MDAQLACRSLLCLSLLIAAPHLSAQTIRGTLVEQGTGEPVDGGIVILLDTAGAQRGGTLSDSHGRFVLQAPAPGRYRLRAERIGYATTTSPFFKLGAGETREYRLVASTEAIVLEGVVARGERRCTIRPEQGLLAARLWDEARKALRATALTQEQHLAQFEIFQYERKLDTALHIIEERGERSSGWSESPFLSIPPERLAEHGFAEFIPDSSTWYAPDARALLSDPFLNTHCFHTEPGGDEREGMIGLAFRPIPGRDVPDIQGVLWLDRGSAELRFLEYRYVNANLDISMDRVGGRVEFRRLPSGAWIVQRWWIRMPRIGIRLVNWGGGPFTERVLAGFKEDGGEVTRVSMDTGRVFQAGNAVLTGTVFDSTRAAPLAGATVFLSGTIYSVATDAEGRFRLDGLPGGPYSVSFMHPRLESLRIVPDVQEVTLTRGDEVTVALAIPSHVTIWAGSCLDEGVPEGTGVIVGRVYNTSSGVPLAGARVVLSWKGSGSATSAVGRADAVTDIEGKYRICGVPANISITARAHFLDESSGRSELEAPAGQPVRHDLYLRSHETVARLPDGTPIQASRQPVKIVGSILDAETDRPVIGAVVHLAGTDHRDVTDRSGRFVLRKVVPNSYTLQIRHPAYGSRSQLVAVGGGRTVEIEYRLRNPQSGLRDGGREQ